MTSAANPIGPTVPNDISNETVMRAWYQEMWSSVRDLTNERISVKDYGAAGDGVTDDTTAFVTALAVADDQTKVLWIPQGNYRISSTITIANPVTILGEGMSVSTIEPYLGTAGGDVFLITCSDVAMMDFGFDGSNVGSVTLTANEYMIHVNPTSGTVDRFYFENLKFEELQFAAGTYSYTALDTDLRATHCIKVEDSNVVSIENCYAKNISGCFLYTTGVSYIHTAKNYMEDVMWYPIHLNDTTSYFNIVGNTFNPTDSAGVKFGGLIDVASVTGTQCQYGNISGNFLRGLWTSSGTYSGYITRGAIRVLSSTDVTIANNFIISLVDPTAGLEPPDNQFYIHVGTAGTSSANDNGPCVRINILNNYIEGNRDAGSYHPAGILVDNDYQTNNLTPADSIKVIGNQLNSNAASTHYLERGIVFNGKSGGIRNIVCEDNTVIISPEALNNLSGRGAISFISDDSQGKCYQIFLGGNKVQSLLGSSDVKNACICIGQYTSEVFNTKPNYLKGYSYGVVTETGAGSDLWYLDDNYYEPAGANNTKFVFNVQPRSKHINLSGNTASRPTSDNYLTNYMTYFDTTLGTPVWYNGSSWIGAWGSADSIAETISDQVGTMVTGNTETGITVTYDDADNTLDFAVSDTTVAGDTGSTGITPGDTLTIAGGSGITTAMSGDTLTITNTSGAADTSGIQRSWMGI